MSEAASEQPEPDPALVEAMASRVVRRKTQSYGNRKAGPGRPKGGRKTGGRKACSPNLLSPEFRAWLSERARPFEVLAAICSGEEIEDSGSKRKPTLSERMRAAETLARKILPDLAATTLTGKDGGPVALDAGRADDGLSDIEAARRIAFMLAQGLHQAAERDEPPSKPALPEQTRLVPQPPEIAPVASAPAPEAVGDLVVSFAEAFPDGRQRWQVREHDGKLIATAFGREQAILKAKEAQ